MATIPKKQTFSGALDVLKTGNIGGAINQAAGAISNVGAPTQKTPTFTPAPTPIAPQANTGAGAIPPVPQKQKTRKELNLALNNAKALNPQVQQQYINPQANIPAPETKMAQMKEQLDRENTNQLSGTITDGVNTIDAKTGKKIDTSAPTTQEKTITTTPQGQTTVVKETPTADYNVGKGREQDMLNNLNEGYNKDVNIKKSLDTGDYETFKQAYGYDTADQTKKNMIDSYFQARQPKTTDAFFNTLVTGQKILNSKYKESPEARTAQHRYDIISPFKGASTDSIYNGMVNGTITPGSDAYKDLLLANGGVETPDIKLAKEKYAKKQATDRINEATARQNADKTGTEYKEKVDTTEKIVDNLISKKGFDYTQRYNEVVSQNPEVADLAEQIRTDTLRKKEIDRIRSNIFKEIVKNNPGMTMGAANLKAKYESEAYDDEYNNLIDTLNVNSSNLQYKTSQLEKAFDYEYKQAQTEEERAYQQQQSDKEFSRQKEYATFQQNLGLQANQAEFEQKVKQQAQMTNDPYTAISTVMDQYMKLGVPFTQSVQTKVADAQRFIANGGTIGQYVDNMIKDIQEKKEYKAIMQKQKGIDIQTIYDANGNQVSVKVDAQGNITPISLGEQPQTGATYITQGTTTNRPDRNNNPFNVKLGSLKKYGLATDMPVDDQGHVIFNTPEEGLKYGAALIDGIVQKYPDVTIGQLGWAEDKTWNAKVAKNAGVDMNTKVSDIDPNTLFQAIAKQEGFTGTINLGQQKTQFTANEMNIMDNYIKNPGSKDSLSAMKRAGLSENEVNAYTSMKNTENDSISDYTLLIKKTLPTGQVDQPGEVAKIERKAKEYLQKGLTPQDAVLDYMGLQINKPEEKDLAISLYSSLQPIKGLPTNYAMEIARRINNGDTQGAKNYVMNAVDKDIKATYGQDAILTGDIRDSIENTDRIISLINRNRDKIGPVAGRASDLLQKVSSDPGYQELKTLLQGTQADIRKYFAGSAVTTQEMSALEDFINGTSKATPDNLLTMIKTVRDKSIRTYNNQRDTYNVSIPEVGDEEKNTIKTMSREDQINSILSNYKK